MNDDELFAGRSDRFRSVIAAIDAVHATDPETVLVDGRAVPLELLHARLMCDWVLRLDPEASELQLIAARAGHLRRWALPRSDFAPGRTGYLRWRTEQKRRHAAVVAELMQRHGYEASAADRVSSVVRKQGLAVDPAVQTHEDALILVFLATQFDALHDKLGDAIGPVVAKTVRKMSERGIAAVAELGLPESTVAIIREAVSS